MVDERSHPVAPEFVAFRRNREFRVSFDQDRSEIILTDDKGRQIDAVPWTSASRPLQLDGDRFSWEAAPGHTPLAVREDDYGMALAFVHFVNQRIPMSAIAQALGEPIPGVRRFQYAVISVGIFQTPERMSEVLASAGSRGWELVTVYDKASNWLSGMEKGIMLLKREIPEGVDVSEWCITLRS